MQQRRNGTAMFDFDDAWLIVAELKGKARTESVATV